MTSRSCTFDMRVNLQALGRRVKIAGKQLERDLKKDPNSRGFIVLEIDYGGQRASEAIEARFLGSLQQRCLGIALISDYSCIVYDDPLADRDLEIMIFAASDLDENESGAPHSTSGLFIAAEGKR
jgi:hypothetical protein